MSYTYKYPHFALTVDMVIFSEDLKQLLLIQRKNPPFKDCWAFPGGFVEINELIVHAAHRELKEETGLSNIELKNFGFFDAVHRDPRERVVSFAFTGKTPVSKPIKAKDDAKNVQWFPVGNLPNLAFDHLEILLKAIKANQNPK
ncbi:NUDIX hydrolase [Echinicola jeungdonensis]|uniref:NUDIX domain-containing protein n=1 Tax=Echinicola jeungdonensis TaxID=709343 RepID=A0ABV5J9A5_9BACT|nr:NUDIX hydrolase [Echinicola jeungdonensis]MDN3670498.1 NUDIX hydrolase [Echinicola jeungdonensis]